VADAKAQAAALEAKISQTSMQIGTLGQQYDAAKYHEEQLQVEIGKTKDAIASQQAKVADDRVRLRKAAINAYISNGTAANSNPLFASDQRNFAAKVVYAKVAEGRLTSAVAKLTNSQDQLAVQQTKLQSQQSAAQAATASASSALQQAKTLQAQQDAALNQANSQVASLVKQAQQAKEAAQATQARAAASAPGGNSGGPTRSYPVPPPAPGGAGAVAAAMSQIGVPYVWAAMSPGVGFDCSGLTAWAWGQAGVGLPHYSGAQMSASTPVPSLADALPGDLIFYGPGGSAHVAMYIGGGSMIEAPQTGSFVHISPVRMDFVRIGRP
jgi:cell wall-associated NlpC family hydrolase